MPAATRSESDASAYTHSGEPGDRISADGAAERRSRAAAAGTVAAARSAAAASPLDMSSSCASADSPSACQSSASPHPSRDSADISADVSCGPARSRACRQDMCVVVWKTWKDRRHGAATAAAGGRPFKIRPPSRYAPLQDTPPFKIREGVVGQQQLLRRRQSCGRVRWGRPGCS
eukprot:164841-Chlamydomonas_euryale.AAC.1